MNAQHFEPMTVGQIIDRAFRLYRNNFIRFVAIVAIIYIPITLISLGAVGWLTSASSELTQSAHQVSEGRPGAELDLGAFGSFFTAAAVTALLFLLAQALCNAALIKSVSESYLGKDVSVGQAYKAVLPRLLSIIGAAILVAIVTGIGFLLLIIPGIIFALWYTLTPQAIVVEGKSATSGMSRSKALVSGNLGKVFGLWIVVGIINAIIGQLFQYVGGLVAGVPSPGDYTTPVIVQQLFSMAGQMLIMPISAGAFILLYYDLRIRKEGFDLQMLAQSLGSAAQEVPEHGAPPVQY